MFHIQQSAFEGDALFGGITPEGAVAGDDTMARNDDRHRVAGQGVTDGACGTGSMHAAGELAVGQHLTVGNLGACGEHLALEVGQRIEIEWNIEGRLSAREVSAQLLPQAGQYIRIMNGIRKLTLQPISCGVGI